MSEYYIRDSRRNVGDCAIWWRAGGEGYACDLKNAGKFSATEARRIHSNRSTDLPFLCEEVDAAARMHVTQGGLAKLESGVRP